MCDCKTRLEKQLTEKLVESLPTDTGHSVELKGYGLAMAGDEMVELGYMEAAASSTYMAKSGVYRVRNKRQKMVFSFCPFCGVAVGARSSEVKA